MPRAVFDPGVLVSAAIAPHGVCGRLLQAAIGRRFELVVCPMLLAELNDVLLRPKFRRYLSTEQAHRYVSLLNTVAELRSDPLIQPGVTSDPDDDYLFALARAAMADYLISGDTHGLEVVVSHVRVRSPRSFFEVLNLNASDNGSTRGSPLLDTSG